MATPSPDPAPSAPPNSGQGTYSHFIFISYSRKDSQVARWLQRRLEWFRFPVQLVPQEKRPNNAHYLRPVYRDKTHLEVDDAHYWQNIRHALENSRYLVVLCSPDAARSGPVDQEVRHFLATHPAESAIASVVPIIIRGKVGSGDSEECLCPALKELGSQITDRNLPTLIPDGAGTEKEGWENGLIGLVAYLLHLKRQDLLNHVRREERRKALIARSLATLFALLAIAACITGYLAYQNAIEAQAQKQEAERQKDLVTQKNEEQDKLLLSASQGDHEAALRAIDEGRHSDALAYFHRALKSYPKNTTALTASADFAIGHSSKGFLTRSITKFEGTVHCVGFSPDGRWVAAGSNDETLRVMEAATGKEVSRLKFDRYVSSVNFSPDGRWVAAGSGDKTLRVVEAATGKEISRVKFDDELIWVRFSPDGRSVAAVSRYRTLRVIEAATGKEVSRLKFDIDVTCMDFSLDGRWVAAGSDDQTLRVVEVATGKEISRLKFDDELISVSFSYNGHLIAAENDDQTLRVVEAATGKEVSWLKLDSVLTSLSFSPDDHWVAAVTKDKMLQVMEVATGKLVSRLKFNSDEACMSFSPDGRWLAAGAGGAFGDNTLRVVEAATGKEISLLNFDNEIACVSFSPDGRWVVAGSRDHTLRVVESALGKEISRSKFDDSVNGVSFSPDGRWLAAVSRDKTLRVVEAATGTEVSQLKFDDYVNGVSFSPNGRWVAAGSDDETLRVVEAATGNEISRLKFDGKVTSVSFSPDARLVAAVSHDRTLRVMEAATGKEVSRLKFLAAISRVNFSPDGRWIAAGGGGVDQVLRVMDVATGTVVSQLMFDGEVTSLSFSTDGSLIAAGGGVGDHTLRVMETATGKEVLRRNLELWVNSVSFSPDGRWIAVGEGDTLWVIEAATGKEISRQKFADFANSVSFSPDGRWIATGGGLNDQTLRVMSAVWLPQGEASPDWLDSLSFRSGKIFNDGGRMLALTSAEMQDLSQKLYANSGSPRRSSQMGSTGPTEILEWICTSPEKRTLTPWIKTPLWKQTGERLMGVLTEEKHIIQFLADRVPWHPLVPISLARAEINPSNQSEQQRRLKYLVDLTLKRLAQADESLYGKDTLIQYQGKVSEWMVTELSFIDDGFKISDQILAHDPNQIFALRAKVSALKMLGRPSEALAIYQDIWKLPDIIAADFYDAGYLAAMIQNGEVADQAFTLAKVRFPQDSTVFHVEGWARLNLNEVIEATQALERCLQIRTAAKMEVSSRLLAGLTAAHWLNKDPDKSMENCKALIEADIKWSKPANIQSSGWPEVGMKPLMEAQAATLKKYPELAPAPEPQINPEQ